MQKGNPASTACMFFLFLLLTPVSPQCREATADECDKIKEFVPGHDLASQGFDITTLQHRYFDVLDLSEWQKSDGSCILCENPLLPGKPLQRLPLAITEWSANITCQQKVQHSMHHSAISMAQELTRLDVKNDWKKELDVDVKACAERECAFSGSESRMASFTRLKILQDTYTFLLHHASCSYYKFRIGNGKAIGKQLESDIQLLPEKYEPSSKVKYQQLIDTYGTHFITEFDLGVRARFLTAAPVCLMVLEGYNISDMSICLEIEVGITMGFAEVTKSPDFQMCKKNKKLISYILSQEHLRNMEGGRLSFIPVYSYPEESIGWLESAKSDPALLSYSLEPLHTLLEDTNLRKESLRQAVSEYVRKRAIWKKCTRSCPPGVPYGPSDLCSCQCPNNNFTNSMCCSLKEGVAKLTVTIEGASDLWGDYITGSDSYVKVLFKDKSMRTPTVWNNNYPVWNANFHFGIIQVQEDLSIIELQVWDQDFGWNDDLLGKCRPTLLPWDSTDHECYLNHGVLRYKYHLACGPHLGGRHCMNYITAWPERK